MSPADSPNRPGTVRLAGYALLGVGGLALVMGAGTAFSGEPDPTAAAPGPTSSLPPPVASQAVPPGDAGPNLPVAPAEPPQQPEQPPAPHAPPNPPESGQDGTPARPGGAPGRDSAGGQNSDGKGATTRDTVVRVYNNGTIKGLAERAANDFRSAGYQVPEVGNYARGRIATTTVYYRPGTPEQAQAGEFAERFGARVEPRFPGIEHASPGVVVILTNDYRG